MAFALLKIETARGERKLMAHGKRNVGAQFIAPWHGRDKSHSYIALIAIMLTVLLVSCDSGGSNNSANPNGPSTIGTPKVSVNFKGTVTIGVSAPSTGDTADGGQQIIQGVQLAAQQANDNGGLLDGLKVNVVAVDDKASTSAVTSTVQKLLAARPVAVVGHKDSGVSIPASVLYHNAGVLEITPTSSNVLLTHPTASQPLDNIFRVCPIDANQGPFLVDFVVNKLGKKHIAFIHADTAYGIGLFQAYQGEMQKLGQQQAGDIQIHRGNVDFTNELKQVQSWNPDAVVYSGSLPEAVIILQQMHDVNTPETNINATFIGGDTLFQAELIRTVGKAAEGSYVSAFAPDPLKDSATQGFVSDYRALFQRDPGANSISGYVAAEAIFAAIKQANSADPAAITAAMRNVKMDSPIGPIAFDQYGDLTDQTAHLHLFEVQNGDFVEVSAK